jgi:hypothetical protein
MKKERLTFSIRALMWAMMLLTAYSLMARAQTGNDKKANKSLATQSAGTTATSAPPVLGTGVPGQIARWAASAKNNLITDSVITQDDFGKIGIGTTTPSSKLTVAGMIETTLGGYKFPDGTVQTTAAANGLASIIHDPTLAGNGTAANPLSIALPLDLSASVAFPLPLVKIANTSNATNGGNAVLIQAGDGAAGVGGTGLDISAGDSVSSSGGIALRAEAGMSNSGNGGTGAVIRGGNSASSNGGDGALISGGNGSGAGKVGGVGLIAGAGGADNNATPGKAALFLGDVDVSGMLSKGGGSFKIDHPLDPANKYLYHSFVESPDMMNIYNGNVVTDVNGDAVVEMPDYFESLNRDFRYQLTVIGTFAQVIVTDEIKGNRFAIKTSAPNVKVSWQVTGVRHDRWADQHRISVEEVKTEAERGFYLHPEAFKQPEEKGIEWARQPEMMKQMKALRERNKQNQE